MKGKKSASQIKNSFTLRIAGRNLSPWNGVQYKQGWIENYYNPMREYLEKSQPD